MAWRLEEPISGISLTLRLSAGNIQIDEDQLTSVLWPLRGSAPYVVDHERRLPAINVPPLVIFTDTEFETLRTLRSMSRVLKLIDDSGKVWPVMFLGGLQVDVIDTVDRPTAPIRYVTVQFVGQAPPVEWGQ